ncbi:aminoglycoside phosphotransferase family protein [Glaciihabitans arcticus]|uniref:Aminoglycoside phosphotransferase family protein n=1 Tax=Glaciihabitans arcticus TaxID=2668039 RepID=A0A4Q9GV59_9MICO|nr:phosphotransferase [Glaciihabitans arcticus]TBN57087.1 aminoglycoside phosphotransferase family protein [Glaciihabitans arcticus]
MLYRERGDLTEHPLEGGDVTEGLVRIGETVRRPSAVTSEPVRRLLEGLAELGFAGAPRHLGVDAADRHVLDFVSGEVATRPWPAWLGDEDRLASVARLVRAYDDAALEIGLPEWSSAMLRDDPPGTPPTIAGEPQFIGHVDITPENVVFRDDAAFSLIDFDLARPATRAEEVVNMLLWWAPWVPVEDREYMVEGVDPFHRAGVIVDAYGLSDAERASLVPLSRNLADRSWHLMKHRAETLGGGWARMWGEGVGDRILRRQRWLAQNEAALREAVR